MVSPEKVSSSFEGTPIDQVVVFLAAADARRVNRCRFALLRRLASVSASVANGDSKEKPKELSNSLTLLSPLISGISQIDQLTVDLCSARSWDAREW
ncbi:hypothetical protein Dimus_007171 [Dionaea muscipula]